MRGLRIVAALALVGGASAGCFVEASAGYYAIKHAEVDANTATQIGISFGFYYDMGVSRVAVGVGGEVLQADGYEDADGTGSVAHGVGPYYGRIDLAMIPLAGVFTLDVTAGVFGGTGPAVVVYNDVTVDDCVAGCGPAVGDEEGHAVVKHAGFSLGGYAGPSIALADQGSGELRLTVAASVLHTDIAPRDPLTAFGAQVRLVYGWTQFGSKDASFATMWRGYSNDLDDDMSRHNRNQSEHNQRRQEQQRREQRERERRRREKGR